MKSVPVRREVACGLILCAMLMASCGVLSPGLKMSYMEDGQGAVPDAKSFWPDAKLEKRFARYWKLRFEGAWEKTLEMEAPHFREMVDVERYKMYVGILAQNTLLGVDLKSFERRTDHLVRVEFFMRFRKPDGQETRAYVSDHWVLVHGKWYHLITDTFYFIWLERVAGNMDRGVNLAGGVSCRGCLGKAMPPLEDIYMPRGAILFESTPRITG